MKDEIALLPEGIIYQMSVVICLTNLLIKQYIVFVKVCMDSIVGMGVSSINIAKGTTDPLVNALKSNKIDEY